MYGRYGTDTLNLVLLIAGLVIAFIAQLTRFWPLTLIAYAFYIYAIFRMLSGIPPSGRKNIILS